jgi:hypothetical protein
VSGQLVMAALVIVWLAVAVGGAVILPVILGVAAFRLVRNLIRSR